MKFCAHGVPDVLCRDCIEVRAVLVVRKEEFTRTKLRMKRAVLEWVTSGEPVLKLMDRIRGVDFEP